MIKNKFIKKSVIAIVIFAVLDIIFIGAAIWMGKKITTTENAIKKFVASSENKSFRTDELRAALDKIRKTREEVETYDSHIFKTGEELSLINDLEKYEDKNNVDMQIVNTNLDQVVDNKITLNLLVTGTYTNVLNYLLDLESHNYFLSVETINLMLNTDPNSYNNESQIRMNIIISVYAQKGK